MFGVRPAGLALASLLLLTACGGGGGGTAMTAVTPAATTTTTTTPAATTATTTTAAPAAAPAGTTPAATTTSTQTSSVATSWAQVGLLYDAQPDTDACKSGTLKQAVRDDVLAKLNAIRALHRLPPVTYAANATDTAQATASSLIMSANVTLTHTPPTTLKCWTQAGYDGAGSANLAGGVRSPFLVYNTEDQFLGGWLDEINNLNAGSIGHRRWLLDPFLGQIAYDRVAQVYANGDRIDGVTLKVFNFASPVATPTGLPDFVAYPYGDYPARYFDTRSLLSFTVVADKSGRFGANGNVNYSGASIAMTGPNGTSVTVSNIGYDNYGYGVANSIQWSAAGLVAGATYTVNIANVIVSGTPRSYSYTFKIV